MKIESDNEKITVLLIEDDEDDYVIIRELLSEIRTHEFGLKWVSQYDEAKQELDRSGYDVCLLDYRLGGQTGLELLNEAEAQRSKIPIVLLTGQGDYKVDIMAMKSGASDYVVKDDLTTSLLERTIRYAVERARAREALAQAHNDLEKKVKERTAQLAEANWALERQSERVRNFAYSISHDLKSPAISLHGLTRRLRKKYRAVLDERGKTYCDHILKASEQIISLVEQINKYISAKEGRILIQQIEMKEILGLIRQEFLDSLDSRGIIWQVPEVIAPVRADRVCVTRILRNLVDNALKYGGNDLSRIEIGFEESEENHIFSVSDDGAGINEEDRQGLFEMFSRKSEKGKPDGAGMGLAIVKELAERHGGSAWLDERTCAGFKVSVALSKYPKIAG